MGFITDLFEIVDLKFEIDLYDVSRFHFAFEICILISEKSEDSKSEAFRYNC